MRAVNLRSFNNKVRARKRKMKLALSRIEKNPPKGLDKTAELIDKEVWQEIEDAQRREVPKFKAGDTVKVHFRVIEGNRQRVQVFEGTLMRLRGGGITRSITVRT
mgnify:CR=1 FL=1